MSDLIYPSKYSNDKLVTAAQYITEIICERKACIDKEDLHFRFWVNKKWAAFYRNQIASANKLLKTYPDKAIIKALNSKEAQKIYSLRAPHLPAIIEKQAKILAAENKKLTLELDRSEKTVFRKSVNSNNILSKLKDLDNES